MKKLLALAILTAFFGAVAVVPAMAADTDNGKVISKDVASKKAKKSKKSKKAKKAS